ncbi:E3 ubiquitin-protein ligase At1g63170-like isoform X1 [Phoenix dactylifera]|uniref:E3 ubiquitin-protein ligase At1g63170-like isoform X1 n=1 Tax=Phoenix dactylifera TaxID=42345 RepID=A0A8B8JCP4_PHODC|nr:E3 ubiquitin-protein ligase At1g63170-like isoform X1 [Phoenix dactylifera]XP_008809175.1 E3 ubiquitin-protein ligase At1g63170-like isoform X1 [Phoenix dactylifera]XP_008809181.1 E3 ubiquitin-protein ligase At1g63170-like isoform X1 [Phoenix dactylifera]XP_008809191.1 E3 ubiquitin-protein ligase At1g63170-like isoform X1 [Phoenix dactylifera]XP_026665966.1 E3 ubiquitin-protein ligase At1g63170-like isoform X1 [Phoenix dactylifera]
MAVPFLEPQGEVDQTDRNPLLMEQPVSSSGHEHVIIITRGDVASTSISHDGDHNDSDELHYEDGPSTSTQAPTSRSSSPSPTASNSRNVSSIRRGDNHGRRRRSPLNSGLWISIELIVNVSQIIAAVIVLSLSRHEHPQAPLFAWVIGYTAGCIATLPHLYWRYIHRNGQGSEQETEHSRQSSSQNNIPESTSYTTISFNQALEGENRHSAGAVLRFGQNLIISSPRLSAMVDHYKMALDCFFAVWFVVGNVWIFGGHSSSSDAPNLYRLCIAFLTFSCIGYAMPFILCATICCCLPCIISILGFREDLGQTRGATSEAINALPTYKFKAKRSRNRGSEINSENLGDGGIVAAGTDKERVISAEDACVLLQVCCICLAKYADNDELRELPCSHFFHMVCVDKWLKINALCPLCKSEVGDAAGSIFSTHFGRRHGDGRFGSSADATRSAI